MLDFFDTPLASLDPAVARLIEYEAERQARKLRSRGWAVLRLWEHEVSDARLATVVERIKSKREERTQARARARRTL